MVDKKAPELRFKGFTEDWEQCKLGEEVDIFDGTHQTPEYTDEGVKFVSVENISTLETKKYISLTAYEQEYHKKQAEKGDVLMTRIGDVGTSKVIDTAEPLAYYVTLALLKPKEITSDFLAWLIESPEVQRNIWKRTLHIAFPKKINLGEINQIDIFLPNIDEQLKIGDFLKRLDYTITLHQRKLDQLKDLKQAYLQQLFPSDGEYTPKVRFANFNRDWEQRKLGENSKLITKGTTPKSKVIDGKINFIKVENIINGKIVPIQKISEEEHNTYLKRSILKKDDILFSIAGTLGRTALVDESVLPANVNQALAIIRGYKFDTNFLITILNGRVVSEYIRTNPTVGAQPNLSLAQVKSLVIDSPVIQEQKKIGNFFKVLNNTITLHQNKLESLNKLKQAYLQKMFI